MLELTPGRRMMYDMKQAGEQQGTSAGRTRVHNKNINVDVVCAYRSGGEDLILSFGPICVKPKTLKKGTRIFSACTRHMS